MNDCIEAGEYEIRKHNQLFSPTCAMHMFYL